jgi:hypothetical protein
VQFQEETRCDVTSRDLFPERDHASSSMSSSKSAASDIPYELPWYVQMNFRVYSFTELKTHQGGKISATGPV